MLGVAAQFAALRTAAGAPPVHRAAVARRRPRPVALARPGRLRRPADRRLAPPRRTSAPLRAARASSTRVNRPSTSASAASARRREPPGAWCPPRRCGDDDCRRPRGSTPGGAAAALRPAALGRRVQDLGSGTAVGPGTEADRPSAGPAAGFLTTALEQALRPDVAQGAVRWQPEYAPTEPPTRHGACRRRSPEANSPRGTPLRSRPRRPGPGSPRSRFFPIRPARFAGRGRGSHNLAVPPATSPWRPRSCARAGGRSGAASCSPDSAAPYGTCRRRNRRSVRPGHWCRSSTACLAASWSSSPGRG